MEPLGARSMQLASLTTVLRVTIALGARRCSYYRTCCTIHTVVGAADVYTSHSIGLEFAVALTGACLPALYTAAMFGALCLSVAGVAILTP